MKKILLGIAIGILISALFIAVVFFAKSGNENIEATKGVSVGENTNTVAENTSAFELSQTQTYLLSEYAQIIPECTEETILTEEYAKEFMFYYYTIKPNENEYNDNYWYRAVWEKSVVENDYQTVFGKPLPKMTLQSSGGDPVIYKDGHYHIGRSNSEEIMYTYSGLENNGGSYFAIMDISYPDMPDRGVVGEKIIEIEPANSSVGFIVKSVKTEYYNR